MVNNISNTNIYYSSKVLKSNNSKPKSISFGKRYTPKKVELEFTKKRPGISKFIAKVGGTVAGSIVGMATLNQLVVMDPTAGFLASAALIIGSLLVFKNKN